MADVLRADLDELLFQGCQRPVFDRLRRRQCFVGNYRDCKRVREAEGSGANGLSGAYRRKLAVWRERRQVLSMDDLFKGRHFDREIIILCVRWYLRFKLSFRGLDETSVKKLAADQELGRIRCILGQSRPPRRADFLCCPVQHTVDEGKQRPDWTWCSSPLEPDLVYHFCRRDFEKKGTPIRKRAYLIPCALAGSQLKSASRMAARAYGAAVTSFPRVASADASFPQLCRAAE